MIDPVIRWLYETCIDYFLFRFLLSKDCRLPHQLQRAMAAEAEAAREARAKASFFIQPFSETAKHVKRIHLYTRLKTC